jgi:hypothetical protein
MMDKLVGYEGLIVGGAILLGFLGVGPIALSLGM